MNERQAIARLLLHFPPRGPGLRLGPGDDCAVLATRPGFELCATTDCVRAGVHFGPAATAEDVGHKALAVNLSDLAAMGARPRWFLAAVELAPPARPSLVDGLARGLAALARTHGCSLVGGNFSRGPSLAVTITALGELPVGTALRRSGLRPGHLLAVTGTVGGAALGLERLREGRRGGSASRAQLRPEPRVAAGIKARGIASAAIDLSDGLAGDLGHLCEASGCGATLWADRLPLAPELGGHPDGLSIALSGGEDYELLFGVPARDWPRLRRRVEATGAPLSAVGVATVGKGVRLAADERARTSRRLRPQGFSHF